MKTSTFGAVVASRMAKLGGGFIGKAVAVGWTLLELNPLWQGMRGQKEDQVREEPHTEPSLLETAVVLQVQASVVEFVQPPAAALSDCNTGPVPTTSGSDAFTTPATVPASLATHNRIPDGFAAQTVKQLRQIAKARGLSGYSRLRKNELLELLNGQLSTAA